MTQLFNSTMRNELEYISEFVDREQELQICIDSILNSQKVLILGERGIGKTVLVKRIESEIKRKHGNIIPVYIRFSPSFEGEPYIYEIFICFIQYIWTNILGNNPSDLYNKDSIVQNEFSRKVIKIHKLIKAERYSDMVSRETSLFAHFGIQVGKQSTKESETTFQSLTSQELNNLFVELIQDLIQFTDASNIVLLIDEANILIEKVQYEIERNLSNLFSLLPYSFVYVASLPMITGKYSLHTESFEQVVYVEGFNNVKYSKKLLSSRIIDKNLVSIEEEVFTILHNASNGNPRNLIEIMRQICIRQSQKEASHYTIKVQDAKEACADYLAHKELEKQRFKISFSDHN